MIKFLKNLFKRNKKDNYIGSVLTVNDSDNSLSEEEHYREGDLEIFINRKYGMIRIEAPSEVELSHEEIAKIALRYIRNEF